MCFGLCELVVAPHRPRATSLPKRKFSFARCFSSNFSSSPSHWLRSERRFYNLNSIIAHNTKRSICWDVWETLESEENEISVREYSFPKKYERDATTFSAKSQKLRFFYIHFAIKSESELAGAGRFSDVVVVCAAGDREKGEGSWRSLAQQRWSRSFAKKKLIDIHICENEINMKW